MIKKFVALALFAPFLAVAAPVGLDGSIGAEWAGVVPAVVFQDSAAPVSNFGSPTNINATGYNIYERTDGNYLYIGLQTTGAPSAATPVFGNLYFALLYGAGPTPSTIGFELTNDRAFKPGDPSNTYYNDTAANLIRTSVTAGGGSAPSVIEAAIDLSVFRNNALGVAGFTGLPSGELPFGILTFLSQSFGYSVAGGNANYGPTQLGFVPLLAAAAVPEPETLALFGLALGAAALVRRRGKRSAR